MLARWRTLIEAIHAAPQQCVVVVTGGGASAIADLLVVPGGSRTVLEAAVPYSSAALTEWLGKRPEHFCSEETALAMAVVAYERGCRLAAAESRAAASNASVPEDPKRPARPPPAIVGLACTASLASDRPKKGDHRCHIAAQTLNATWSSSVVLEKGARDRPGEESVVGRLILRQLARLAAIHPLPAAGLRRSETIDEQQIVAAPLLVDLRQKRCAVVWSFPRQLAGGKRRPENADWPAKASGEAADGWGLSDGAGLETCGIVRPGGVLCGAFNPLHFGHQELRAAAERQLAGPVAYEMSLHNVDKPPLDYLTIERRRMQFTEQPLALTAAPTFAEKALALPGMTFVVGVDTAERIVAPRYYHDSEPAMHDALSQIRSQRCRFLVAGRKQGDRFITLGDISLPSGFADLFAEIPPQAFRADVSSTELRAKS
ncbi:MAG: hypothetical protein EXS05_01605 [Planctomycetaceae bacterium]|nr:hypothetical protein [Planctomycetaceae bacterium]